MSRKSRNWNSDDNTRPGPIGGTTIRKCLNRACGKPFPSWGKNNRFCDPCRRRMQTNPFDDDQPVRNS